MPFDPLNVIAEILGEPAEEMRNPANALYRCPFLESECVKKSHSLNAPFPVCSVYRRPPIRPVEQRPPLCVCPKRFHEAQLVQDVLANCWVGEAPQNPQVAWEVQLAKFGTIDFVVADYDESRQLIRNFVSVELQAVDITGSYLPAYSAVTSNTQLDRYPQYNFNWANVRKRFISQLIAKGFSHAQWGSRIAAIVQTDLFESLERYATVTPVPIQNANIVFMLYQYRRVENSNRWTLQLDRVVPTQHSIVMNAILYENVPTKASFERVIINRLNV